MSDGHPLKISATMSSADAASDAPAAAAPAESPSPSPASASPTTGPTAPAAPPASSTDPPVPAPVQPAPTLSAASTAPAATPVASPVVPPAVAAVAASAEPPRLQRTPSNRPKAPPPAKATLRRDGKKFHFYVAHCAQTDAPLAKKIYDALRSEIIETARQSRARDLRASVFLGSGGDANNSAAFIREMEDSCAVLPLISEAALAILRGRAATEADAVMNQWENAVLLAEQGLVEIIPILIGRTDGKINRKFSEFDVSNLPDYPTKGCTLPVRTIVGRMLALQGVFLDPQDYSEKLRNIVNMFSKDLWPKFRRHWYDDQALAPEPTLHCIQCTKPYRESQNAPGTCAFHLSDKCCGFSFIPCQHASHRARHHCDYPYARFYTWMDSIMGYIASAQVWTTVYTVDYRALDIGATAEIGMVLPGHPTEANKIFVRLMMRSDNPNAPLFFGVFSQKDLESVNPDIPIGYLSAFPKGFGQGPLEAKASWILDGSTIVGIRLYCKSFTSQPSKSEIYFSFDNGVPKCGEIVEQPPTFGEKSLGGEDPWKLYNGIPRTQLQKGPPRLQFPLPREPETFEPLIPVDCPVFLKLKSASFFSLTQKLDQFTFAFYATNNSNRPATILEASAWFKLRGNPNFPQTEWKPVETMKSYVVAFDQKPINLPIAINAFHTVIITVEVALVRDADIAWRTQSVLARHGPILFDVEFGVAGATNASQVVEYVNGRGDSFYEQPAEPADGLKELIVLEDTKSWDRESFYIHTRSVPSNASDDEKVVVVNGTGASLRILRVAFCRWALARANIPVNDGEYAVSGNKVLLWSTKQYNFAWKVWAVIDPSRRCVFAIRVDGKCGSDGKDFTKFAMLPDYGDALSEKSEDSSPSHADYLLDKLSKEVRDLDVRLALAGLTEHRSWTADTVEWEQPMSEFKRRRVLDESQTVSGKRKEQALLNDEAFLQRISDMVGKSVARCLTPLEQKLQSLEKEVAALHNLWRTHQQVAINMIAGSTASAMDRLRNEFLAYNQASLQKIDYLASVARAAPPPTARNYAAAETVISRIERLSAALNAIEKSGAIESRSGTQSVSQGMELVTVVNHRDGAALPNGADSASIAPSVESSRASSAELSSDLTAVSEFSSTATAIVSSSSVQLSAQLDDRLSGLEHEIQELRHALTQREQTFSDQLQLQMRAAVDHSIESHTDLIAAIVKMSMESRLADLEYESVVKMRLGEANGSMQNSPIPSVRVSMPPTPTTTRLMGELPSPPGSARAAGNGAGSKQQRVSVTIPAVGSVLSQVSEALNYVMSPRRPTQESPLHNHGTDGVKPASTAYFG
ncbi:hypothetical protein DFJ73DRAFT_837676 [Zopfochytrium polystomum]|nr:hypothetical protein DFJ73DRAFT_837676 [Zopfochytrium polystomum]